MKRSDIAMLLTMVKATDDRMTVDEARIVAWHYTLDQEMPYDFARKCVVDHYSNSRNTIMPADINERWRIHRDNEERKAAQDRWRDEQRALEAASVDGRPYIQELMERLTGIPTELRLKVMSVECPRCSAKPQKRCVGMDGNQLTKTYAHQARYEAVGTESPQKEQEAANG